MGLNFTTNTTEFLMKELLNSGPLIIFVISFSYPLVGIFFLPLISNTFLRLGAKLLYLVGLIAIILGSADLIITVAVNAFPKILDHTFMNGGVLAFTLVLTSCLFPAIASMIFVYLRFPRQWRRYEELMRGASKAL
jgi:predicted cation transporter